MSQRRDLEGKISNIVNESGNDKLKQLWEKYVRAVKSDIRDLEDEIGDLEANRR